jgi:hypothetical protein
MLHTNNKINLLQEEESTGLIGGLKEKKKRKFKPLIPDPEVGRNAPQAPSSSSQVQYTSDMLEQLRKNSVLYVKRAPSTKQEEDTQAVVKEEQQDNAEPITTDVLNTEQIEKVHHLVYPKINGFRWKSKKMKKMKSLSDGRWSK